MKPKTHVSALLAKQIVTALQAAAVSFAQSHVLDETRPSIHTSLGEWGAKVVYPNAFGKLIQYHFYMDFVALHVHCLKLSCTLHVLSIAIHPMLAAHVQ